MTFPQENPWVGKILWRRAWQLPPVFLPGKSHGQRSLMGYIQPVGMQRDGHDRSNGAQENEIMQVNFSHKESFKTYSSVMSNSLRPCGLQPTRLLCPWDSPIKNTGVGCHVLFQGIFLTQESNPRLIHLLHCRQVLYHFSSLVPPGKHRNYIKRKSRFKKIA